MQWVACDLFCGAGGVAKGLANAGFSHIDGYDIKPQPNYPFEAFVQDALEVDISAYDFVWASPPCQFYSVGTSRKAKENHKDLIGLVREKLIESGKPYIIENVEGASKYLINPVKLCGTMFPGLKVFRHRLFESNIPLIVEMKCDHNGHKAIEKRGDGGDFYTVAGHMPGTLVEWSAAMGIDWMKKYELREAIPPAYSEYLGKQVIRYLSEKEDSLGF